MTSPRVTAKVTVTLEIDWPHAWGGTVDAQSASATAKKEVLEIVARRFSPQSEPPVWSKGEAVHFKVVGDPTVKLLVFELEDVK